MSARRQSSTTSLSKYARLNPPTLQNRSLDFCNSFWGLGDGGVDVLFARMRGAARTMEELKAFWKERASIEEDYSKRLSKLAKMALGRDEIGELRNSIDTIRMETERQAGFHLSLSQQVRSDLEMPTTTFHARQLQHKKIHQAAIEKEFKTKQTQESYVNKAREKYEQDCVRINSFTAQASLVQGKDLEKINLKLERTQQTVVTNEREFSSFAKALAETVQKWEQDWKSFCDSCQDMEEHRMEFMKDNLWTYANAISTVCVSDDESCEKIRLALEQMELEREMEGFVRDYGTGNQIPDPPAFINYQTPDAIPSSSARPTSRPAQFTRSSSREIPIRQSSNPPDDQPVVNTAGVGAGGGLRRADSHIQDGVDLSRQATRSGVGSSSQNQPQQYQPQQVPYTNGTSHHHRSGSSSSPPNNASQQSLQRRFTASAQSAQLQRVLQDPHAETIDPTAETYIKVGNNAYKVDLSKDPQKQAGPSGRNGVASPTKENSGAGVDPLMKQLEELQNTVSTTGSGRRNTLVNTNIKPAVAATPEQKLGHVSLPISVRPGVGNSAGSSSLAPGGLAASPGSSGPQQNRTPTPVRDYRNSAEVVVGAHPSVSRPASPNPPTAAFMVPKPSTPSGSEIVSEVIADYQQSLPGEHKSISRGHTPSSSLAQNNLEQSLARPSSQLGHAGVGAHGSRSNSPQPISTFRGPSPAPSHPRNSFMQPPPNSGGQGLVRAPSPNAVGIALDPSGRVLHDDMAQRYQQQQQHVPQQQLLQRPPPPPQTQQPAYNPPPPPTQQQQRLSQPPQHPQQQQQTQRRASFVGPPPVSNTMAPPVAAVPYAVTPPPPNSYHTPSPQPSYVQPPPPMQSVYNPPPVQYQPPPPPQQQQQQPRYQQQQPPPPQQPHTQPGYNNVNLQRNPSLAHYNGPPPPHQQVQQVQQPQQMLAAQQQARVTNMQGQGQQQQPRYQQHPQYAYHDQAPTQRSPSPAPPPQATEEGNRVLFYVKALYDYSATIDEEFDFQAGDIIAVTATPDDGWWSGELLDENRRQKGRNVFPSNFVCLF